MNRRRVHQFRNGRRERERGSAAVELAMWTPAMGLFVVAIIFGGRVAVGHQAVQTAAADAARAASIARTASSARAVARTYAAATLANEGLACVTTNVAVDVSAFSAPVGTPGVVRATVVCDVAVGDLGLPGVRGTVRVEATMASPLDTYRERKR